MPSEFKMMKERFRDKVKLKRRKEFLSELNYSFVQYMQVTIRMKIKLELFHMA